MKLANKLTDKYEDADASMREYLKGEWSGFLAGIAWNDLIFLSVAFLIFAVLFGWWSIPLMIALGAGLQAGGGNWIDMEYHAPEPKTRCIAGNLDCKICDSEGNLIKTI